MIVPRQKQTLLVGQTLAAPGALDALERAGQTPADFVARHSNCDWGIVDDEDASLNDEALVNGARILSAYKTTLGVRLWIITEADRSATTILLPSEY